MANNIFKLPIARGACRGFATQVAQAPAEAIGNIGEINCTVLPNKILVSSQDFFGGLSRISVSFRIGPRNEVYKYSGATHIIRSMTGFSTQNFTDFGILRNLQQEGCYLICMGDREITSFTLVGTRDKIHTGFGFLSSVVTSPAFKPWQVSRNFPRIKYELSTLSRETRIMDMLHKAAFRTGLGNTLFMTHGDLERHNRETLKEFYTSSFTCNRAAVVGYNITHKTVVKFAESFTLPSGDPPEGNSKYFGGELRKERPSHFVTVAIGTEGVGCKDLKQALIYAVLQNSLGTAPTIKRGGSPSPLSKSIGAVTSSGSGCCFNVNYSDNGLFGVILTTKGQNAGSVIEAAVKVFRSGELSDADISRGKLTLKMKLLEAAGSSGNIMDDMVAQTLINGVVVPASVLAEAVDKISAEEVRSAAKKVAKGKLSMASFGNLSEIPYVDQLM